LYSGDYTLWKNVPDDKRFVTIQIRVWDDDSPDAVLFNNPTPDGFHNDKDDLADISVRPGGGDESNPDGSSLHLTYDLLTRTWTGDDSNEPGGTDPSPGYSSGEADSATGDQDDCSIKFKIETVYEVSSSAKQALANKFSPRLYFASDEAYFPIDIRCMIDQSDLYVGTTVVDPRPISMQSLINYRTGSYINQPPDTPQTGYANTIYVHVFTSDNNRIVVEYWFFYIYNDGNGVHIPAHEGDWEMITLVFAPNAYDSYLAGNLLTLIPEYACYSQHYSGEKRAWTSVSIADGTHPIVYVEKGGHSSLFTGNYVVTRTCSLSLMAPGAWLNYSGVWGASEWSVPGPVYRVTKTWAGTFLGDSVAHMWHEPYYWSNALP
jgi:hypothetical protein